MLNRFQGIYCHLLLFLGIQLFLSAGLVCSDQDSHQAKHPCGPECICGCVQGGPCTCSREKQPLPPKSPSRHEMPCGPNCTCGCVQGGPCTCNSESDKIAPVSASNYQGESCGNNCPCGCAYGEVSCGCLQGNACGCSGWGQGYYYPEASSSDWPCSWESGYGCYDESYGYCCCEKPDLIDVDINGYMVINEPVCAGGIWLPEDPPLFRPFMADPRQITYSVGWRFNDNALTKNIIDVSYADTCAIYRWLNVGPWGGQLQIELEGALWAVFNPCYESAPLINADYYVGVPITYAIPGWQFRLRGFHISSHIGDEFLLDHPHFVRKNPSAEYLDFFISHDLTPEIRIYGGLGYIVQQDASFKFHRFYSALGAELRVLRLGFLDCRDMLYGCPIFGMHFRQNGDYKKHIDATYVLGYEIGKMTGLWRRLRMFFEYHDGYSVEGQFCKTPTSYYSVRVTYGF